MFDMVAELFWYTLILSASRFSRGNCGNRLALPALDTSVPAVTVTSTTKAFSCPVWIRRSGRFLGPSRPCPKAWVPATHTEGSLTTASFAALDASWSTLAMALWLLTNPVFSPAHR